MTGVYAGEDEKLGKQRLSFSLSGRNLRMPVSFFCEIMFPSLRTVLKTLKVLGKFYAFQWHSASFCICVLH